MIWRWDRAWRGQWFAHAMTLVGDPYFEPNTVGDIDFVMPIWDGSNISTARNMGELAENGIAGEYNWYINGPCDPAIEIRGNCWNSCPGFPSDPCELDLDGDTYIDISQPAEPKGESFGQEKVFFPYKFDPEIDTGGNIITDDAGVPQGTWVHYPADIPYYKYYYYIGQSYQQEEWHVLPVGASENRWTRIGDDVFSLPADEDLRNPDNEAEKRDPKLDQHLFADFDHDGRDDVFWRTDTGDWKISYSTDEYRGWTDVKNPAIPEVSEDIVFYVGNFGSESGGADQYPDIFTIVRNPWNVELKVSYSRGKSHMMSPWYVLRSLSIWWRSPWNQDQAFYNNNARVVDIDTSDSYSDVFIQLADGRWVVFFEGDTYGQVKGVDDAVFVSRYAFVDQDGDGDTDVIRLLRNPPTQTTQWQISELDSNTMTYSNWTTFWTDTDTDMYGYLIDDENNDLRFGRFDDNPRTDVLLQNKNDGNWYILYNFITDEADPTHNPGRWQRISLNMDRFKRVTVNVTNGSDFYDEAPTTLNDIAIGNFAQPGGEYSIHDEIFSYRAPDILADNRIASPPVVYEADSTADVDHIRVGEPLSDPPGIVTSFPGYDTWNIYGQSYIRFDHTFNNTVPELLVYAQGQHSGNAWPMISVQIGGEEYRAYVESDDQKLYRFEFRRPVTGQTEVRVAFPNDCYWENGCTDRNIFIDKIIVREHTVYDTCSNGVKDGLESGVDCGGDHCAPCAGTDPNDPDTSGCVFSSDCESGVCEDGICQAATCTDFIRNGDETDVDCGGSCPGCPDGDDCTVDADCESGVCEDGICQSDDDINWCDCRPDKCNDCSSQIDACAATPGCAEVIECVFDYHCIQANWGCDNGIDCFTETGHDQSTDAGQAAVGFTACMGGCQWP
jgi:hypothetical protein